MCGQARRGIMGAAHALEMPFVFGTFSTLPCLSTEMILKLDFASLSVLRDVTDLGVSVCPDAGGRSSDDQAAQPDSVPTAELSRFAGSGMT